MNKVLQMNFMTGSDKPVTIRFANPKDNLVSSEVQETMELIKNLKVFSKLYPFGYDSLAPNLQGAKVISTTTEEFDITVV